jgi:hypothetical protein
MIALLLFFVSVPIIYLVESRSAVNEGRFASVQNKIAVNVAHVNKALDDQHTTVTEKAIATTRALVAFIPKASAPLFVLTALLSFLRQILSPGEEMDRRLKKYIDALTALAESMKSASTKHG